MATQQIIRAHGVASREEACWLETLGVTMIGVVVGEVASGRVVTREGARQIARALTRARLCLEWSADGEPAADELRDLGAAVVAVPWGSQVSASWRLALALRGIAWAHVRVPADDDDDPSWIQSRIDEPGAPSPAWTEVEVCPSLQDGWSVISEPHDADLDAADLDALASTRPIVFSLAARADNIASIRATLAHRRGVSFTLGADGDGVTGAHRYGRDDLAGLLARLD